MSVKNEMMIDRRVQKTKKALTEALISLILEKGYSKVTIQEIIDKANVGRSTFYIHYENKEQLLLDGHNNLNAKIFSDELGNETQESEISFKNLINHISENYQLAKAMLGKNSGNMMSVFFKNNISLKIRKRYIAQFSRDKIEQKRLAFLSDATAAAVVSLIISWIEDEMIFSVEEVSSSCQNLVLAVFKNRTKVS